MLFRLRAKRIEPGVRGTGDGVRGTQDKRNVLFFLEILFKIFTKMLSMLYIIASGAYISS